MRLSLTIAALMGFLWAVWVATARPEPLIVRPYGGAGGQTLLHGYLK
jgi:hypothetical protein